MARKQNQEVIYGTLQKNVIESYIMANSRQNLSIYSERLLLRLVEIAQSQVFGLDFKGGSGLVRVDPSSLGTIVEMNIADLMSEKDSTNYTVVKKSVLELMQVKHQHEEPIFSNNKPVLDKDGRPRKYSVALLDPCWNVQQKGARGAEQHYDLLPMEKISDDMPIYMKEYINSKGGYDGNL